MKILLLTPSVRPLGARRSLVELVRSLPSHIDPLLVCPSDTGIYLELKDLGIPTRVGPHGAWRKATGRLKALFWQLPALRKIAREFQPQVIHANELHVVPQALKTSTKIPVSGHVRLTITPRQIDTYSMGKCTRIVAVSKAVKSLFSNTAIYDRVKVVYNGVDISAVKSSTATGDLCPEWRSKPSDPPLIFGIFGLISQRKNQLVAVEALSRAIVAGANVRLLIAGDAFASSEEYGDRLRERIGAPDVRDHVAWIPFQKDAGALYRCIDTNLLISGEEGFGRTIIEAGAAGIPSIGTRIGGIPELIEDNQTGWLVSEGDADELARRMVALDASRDAVREAGARAARHVEENFTIQAHAANMVSLWQECIDAGRIV
ncbi:glycosyltransferase family 4 protein [Candidatus Sumerlaeota bacterium]|nr:glycosyltransferase family 4 protein [Candidatus Sumerlaeota bacterium]